MKKVILTLTIISAFIAVLSIVSDPFSIPFQDWDQMPKSTQEMYIDKSADMKTMRNIFGTCFIIGAIYLFLLLAFGNSKEKKNK